MLSRPTRQRCYHRAVSCRVSHPVPARRRYLRRKNAAVVDRPVPDPVCDGTGKTADWRADYPTSRAQPSRAEPGRVEPGRAEPSRAEPSRADYPTSRAEPGRAEPGRAEPSRAEPSGVESSRAAEPWRQGRKIRPTKPGGRWVEARGGRGRESCC